MTTICIEPKSETGPNMTVKVIVSPGLADVLFAVTFNCVDSIGAANTGTAVASKDRTITNTSARDVIRLFMTKLLLLKIYLRDFFYSPLPKSRLVPESGGADFSAVYIFLNLGFCPIWRMGQELRC